jgi:arabinogalactan endo-1,4-beta-galactosidase
MNRNRLFFVLIFLLFFASCKKNVLYKPPVQQNFIRGADLSFLPLWQKHGARYYDRNGHEKTALDIFMENGMNTVRLRLFVHASGFNGNREPVVAFARQIHAKGLKVWLDLHYSDTWADPGHQLKPKTWQNLSFDQLADSVFSYTQLVMEQIKPEYIQLGNEINHGFLWPDGHLSHPIQFAALLTKGVEAVRRVNSSTLVILHYAGYRGAENFFALIKKQNIDYDIIGLSYYPWWHGKSLDTLQKVMNTLSNTFQKPVVVAETAYPFTLLWNDQVNNIIGNGSQLIPDFPATPSGQSAFLQHLRQISETVPFGGGFCYWEPDWVTIKKADTVIGSPWENLALFDFNNQALPAMEIFKP